MGDPLPPDPYVALGISNDATDSQIKSAYRKLALKCHPDKVEGKGDEFHRISQAYDLLTDDDRRRRYDDDIKYMELKRAGGGGGRRPSYAGMRMRTAERPQASYDDEVKFREGIFDPSDLNRAASSRKHDDVERSRRTSAPNPTKAKEATRKSERSSTAARSDKHKESSDRKKQRDRDTARGRDEKYFERSATVESDDSEGNQRAVRDRFRREGREEVREARRSAENDGYFSSQRPERMHKLQTQLDNQREYVSRSSAKEGISPRDYGFGAAPPPPPSRPNNSSSERIDLDASMKRSDGRSRPAGFVRRSRRTSSVARNTPSPEPQPDSRRMPPSFSTSQSSPSHIKIPQSSRDYPPSTHRTRQFDSYDSPLAPKLPRSSTMPMPERRSSTRRGSAAATYGSTSRQMDANNDSGYSTSNNSPDENPSPDQHFKSSSTKYKYSNDNGSVPGLVNIERSSAEPPPLNRMSSASRKYTPENINPIGAPPPPPQTSSARRPSISQTDSFSARRTTSSYSQQVPQTRRTTSYSAASPIPPLKTGRGLPPGTSEGNDGRFFGETDLTASPTEHDFPPSPAGMQAPRRVPANVNYSQTYLPEDVRYANINGRRGSEQTHRSFTDRIFDKEQSARAYMVNAQSESRFRDEPLRGRGLRRAETAM